MQSLHGGRRRHVDGIGGGWPARELVGMGQADRFGYLNADHHRPGGRDR
jgi:hypothetical protein